MAMHLALHHEITRRRLAPLFGELSGAFAAALSARSTEPLASSLSRLAPDAEDVRFAAWYHGVCGLLLTLPGPALPDDVTNALAAERESTRRRGLRLAEDVATLGRLADRHGLPFVPLKGAFLATERYRDVSLRPAADIDVLASPGTVPDWERLLLEEGYVLTATSWKDRVYTRPGEGPRGSLHEDEANPRPVELHHTLKERVLGRTIDLTALYLADVHPSTIQGDVPALLPGPAALAAHLLAHAAPAALGRGLRLVQIEDLRFLSPGADVTSTLTATLGEIAWGVARVVDHAVPGVLPAELLRSLDAAPPSAARRARYLSRPGLATGGPLETEVLLRSQLALCGTLSQKAGLLADAFPDASVLRNLYGSKSPLPVSFVRYYAERLARLAKG